MPPRHAGLDPVSSFDCYEKLKNKSEIPDQVRDDVLFVYVARTYFLVFVARTYFLVFVG